MEELKAKFNIGVDNMKRLTKKEIANWLSGCHGYDEMMIDDSDLSWNDLDKEEKEEALNYYN